MAMSPEERKARRREFDRQRNACPEYKSRVNERKRERWKNDPVYRAERNESQRRWYTTAQGKASRRRSRRRPRAKERHRRESEAYRAAKRFLRLIAAAGEIAKVAGDISLPKA